MSSVKHSQSASQLYHKSGVGDSCFDFLHSAGARGIPLHGSSTDNSLRWWANLFYPRTFICSRELCRSILLCFSMLNAPNFQSAMCCSILGCYYYGQTGNDMLQSTEHSQRIILCRMSTLLLMWKLVTVRWQQPHHARFASKARKVRLGKET